MQNSIMSLQEIWYEINNRIQKIEFNNLWQDFKKYPFAVYNDDLVCLNGELISKTDEFIANTAILYQNQWIAIFRVNGTENLDEISSLIVHEMFHAFQMENKDQRFPNEIEALFKYEYSPENLSCKFLENQLLHQILINKDKNLWFELLAKKNCRKNKHSYSYEYEAKVEQIEGTANYIELKTLKILNETLYKKRLEKMMASLLKVDHLFPIRIGLYDSGALLLTAMDELSIDYDMSFSKIPFAISTLKEISDKEIALFHLDEVESALEKYHADQEEKISKLTQNEPLLVGDYGLRGVNIYDAWVYKNYLYTTYFLSYEDNENEKILYGNYLLDIDNGRIKKIYLDPE